MPDVLDVFRHLSALDAVLACSASILPLPAARCPLPAARHPNPNPVPPITPSNQPPARHSRPNPTPPKPAPSLPLPPPPPHPVADFVTRWAEYDNENRLARH
ncbi:hypothetical protein BCEP4_830002 [Burkholderia cepacia]|nr:hypothetical protein BCEP4_830002 [Burkholderia cepacia]